MKTETLTPAAQTVSGPDGYTVWTRWASDARALDRPATHGIAVGWDHELADRLASAINDGAFHTNPEVVEDVDGKTFVRATTYTIGKYLRSDLPKIGY